MKQEGTNWDSLNEQAAWWSEVNTIFDEITVKENRGFEPVLPIESEKKKYFIEKLNYLMEHNQEKNRDSEGKKSYDILKDIISKLN